MGQYWIPVNLDKREFIDPHRLGTGMKLWEQLANHPGTGAALVVLLATERERRGGGDLDIEENWHGLDMPEDYPEIARRTIGRWAGDRIAIIGDYAERDDLEGFEADFIYDLCCSPEEKEEAVAFYRNRAETENNPHLAEYFREKANRLSQAEVFKDITDDVAKVLEHELQGQFVGEGWRTFQPFNRKEVEPCATS